jgi:hypothetical protein
MKRFQHTSFLSTHFLIFFALLSAHFRPDRIAHTVSIEASSVTLMTSPLNCEEPIVRDITSSTDSICSGERVFLRVDGDLNDAQNWYWYIGECGTEQPVAVGSFITVTPDTTTTYFMRGEGECFPDGLECQTITVTVVDSIAPTISCIGDQVAQVDQNCEYILPDYRVLVVATDDCVEEPVLVQIPAPNSVVSENTEVKIIAWDKNNNSDTCSFRLLLSDPFLPVVACKDDTIYLTNETNLAYLEPQMIDAGSYDACGDIKLRLGNTTTFDCTQLGEHTVTLTAEDRVGNTASCEATVTVMDSIRPMAICQDIEVFLDEQGQASLLAEQVDGGSSDNCELDLMEVNIQQFTCVDLGAQQVSLQVADVSGNTASCTATVTVRDTFAPDLVVDDMQLELDEEGFARLTTHSFSFGDIDNCTLDTLWLSQYDFDCSHLGENTVTLFGKDQAGNEASLNFTVMVTDPIPPTLNCGETRQIVLVDDCSFTIPDYALQVSLADNCSEVSVFEQLPAPGTTIDQDTEVNLKAKDTYGNEVACSFQIRVQDGQAPVVECLGTQTTPLLENCEGIVPDYTQQLNITDNCGTGELAIFQIPAPGQTITSDTMVKIVVVDEALNEAECVFPLLLVDGQAPVIQCPTEPQTIFIEDNCVTSVPDFLSDLSVTDACLEGLQMTQLPQAGLDLAANTVITIKVTDQAGNENTCSFDLEVKDVAKPVVSCGTILFVTIGENGVAEIKSDQLNSLATDNCSIDNIEVSRRFFDCDAIGYNTVTLSALDASGNSASCELTVGVRASLSCATPEIANSGDDIDLNNLPQDTDIGDPCSCMGEGRFSEEVVIGPAKSGHAWEVSQTNLLSVGSETVIPAGTPFEEIPYRNDSSLYILVGIHLDGDGYTLTARSDFFPGQTLSISNTCYYPKPEILNLESSYCLNTPAFELEGTAGQGNEGMGTFRVNGEVTDIFDPAALGSGVHLVEFSWDAGNPAGELRPDKIGCIESITLPVQVAVSTPNFSCNDLVRVNATDQCEAFVTPDMIINARLNCLDDYLVRIYKQGEGGYLPNPIPAEYFGQTLNVIVEHLPSGNFCEGQLIMEDKTPPVINCPGEAFEFACTDYDSIFNRADAFDAIGFDLNTDIYDACHDRSGVTVNWIDEFVPSSDECDNFGKIVRTIDAYDDAGNVAERCQIEFILKTPELQTELIERPFEWNICGEKELLLDNQGRPHPNVSGSPYFINGFGDTVFVNNQSACNFAVAYSDNVIEDCGLSYEVLRTWQWSDPCSSEPVKQLVQVIRVRDKTPPVVSVESDKIPVFSTGPFDCTASFRIPEPLVEDCNATTYSVEIKSVVQAVDIFGVPIPGEVDTITLNSSITGNSRTGYYASNVPLGDEHYIVYKVADDCNNLAEPYWYRIKVEDQIAPVAICGDDINFSIGGNGIGQLLIDDVNQGSRDNCGLIDLVMRREIDEDCLDGYVADVIGRQINGNLTLTDLDQEGNEYFFNNELVLVFEEGKYYSSYDEKLFFFCCDVGRNVTVQLLVGDPSGNSNFCWINIAVEDKVPPLITPPQAITATCDTLTYGITDLTDTLQLQQKFGNAMATDNCGAITTELPPQINLDNCGVGTIIRRFRAKDASGNMSSTVQQVINVISNNNYEIKFPGDALSAQCGVFEADTLEFREIACDQLLINVKEDRFSPSGDECYKILRTYQVINWCEHNGIDDPLTISRDEDGDGIPGEEIFVLRRRNRIFLDDNNDETDGFIREITSVGFWKYTQIINVYDTEQPVVDFTEPTEAFCSYGDAATSCDGLVTLDFGVSDGCSPNDLTVEVFLDPFKDINNRINKTGTAEVKVVNGRYVFEGPAPIGAHQLFVRASDPCGNIGFATIPFEVVDCKVAAPVCKGVNVEIMAIDTDKDDIPDTGMAVVPALALLQSIDSLNDCSGSLKYSVHRADETTIDPDQRELIFTCEDSLNVAIPVFVYVWDNAYNPNSVQPDGTRGGPNYRFCETFVVLQDNQFGVCQEANFASIDGAIMTEKNQPIEGVMVQLSGTFSDSLVTDLDGYYMFEDLETNYDYSVRPQLNHNYRNGVSTIDMVLISKHILGTESLPTAYRMIAADINNSQSVTTFDLIQMRKLILALTDKFDNNSSWRFVDTGQEFPNTSNPWLKPLKEVVNFNNIETEDLSANFVGVKIGDVNLNAQTNSLIHSPRSAVGDFEIQVSDQDMEPGQLLEVTFASGVIADIAGFQFTLELLPDQLELVDIEYGLAQAGDFGFRYIDEGLITSSWYPQGAINPEGALFKLILRAKDYGRLSEAIHLSSRLTQAEAYSQWMEDLDVKLVFQKAGGQSVQPAFKLEQNRPNPFNDQTTISFTLPEAGEASLSIYDANGRMIKMIRGNFDQGMHNIELNAADLPSGLLYYRLESGSHQAIKKMILVK